MRASTISAKSSPVVSRSGAGGASFAQRLGELGPELDLLVVALDEPVRDVPAALSGQRASGEKWRLHLRGCLMAIALCVLVTLIGRWWLVEFDTANAVMIYLLAVVLVALRFGRWPSVFATVINILAFDRCLWPHRHGGGIGSAISGDLCGDAGGRGDCRQSHRRRALSGAGGALP